MTKKFSIIALWCLLLGLTACGSGSPTALPSTPTDLPTPTPAIFTPTASPLPPTPAITLVPQPTVNTPAPTPRPTNANAKEPPQPTTGPGSSEKTYQEMISHTYGESETSYYIFEPTSPKPTKPLPVILLLHGYSDLDPTNYQAWIEHLVERGNLVIFPVYQTLTTDGTNFVNNAANAYKSALDRLKDGTHDPADLSQTLIIGYSAGGVVATDLTARAAQLGLPQPTALMDVAPGGCANCSVLAIRNFLLADSAELAAIPPQTKFLLVVGDRDIVVGRTAADIIWKNLAQLPAANKNYLEMFSDNHGTPTLIADHGMTTHRPPTALQYDGIWKLFDGLQNCALSGQDCQYALGGTPQQLDLGNWSDGVPVTPLKVLG